MVLPNLNDCKSGTNSRCQRITATISPARFTEPVVASSLFIPPPPSDSPTFCCSGQLPVQYLQNELAVTLAVKPP